MQLNSENVKSEDKRFNYISRNNSSFCTISLHNINYPYVTSQCYVFVKINHLRCSLHTFTDIEKVTK